MALVVGDVRARITVEAERRADRRPARWHDVDLVGGRREHAAGSRDVAQVAAVEQPASVLACRPVDGQVLGVLTGRRAGLRRYGFANFANQLLRAFVEAYHRVRRIVGRFVQVKDVFHRCDKVRADLGDTPFPYLPGFQGVFLRASEPFHG